MPCGRRATHSQRSANGFSLVELARSHSMFGHDCVLLVGNCRQCSLVDLGARPLAGATAMKAYSQLDLRYDQYFIYRIVTLEPTLTAKHLKNPDDLNGLIYITTWQSSSRSGHLGTGRLQCFAINVLMCTHGVSWRNGGLYAFRYVCELANAILVV